MATMSARRVLIYFAWSRPDERHAPLTEIDDRFPALFELRRWFYPKFESLSDARQIDQGIGGFLDHVQKPNFAAFVALARAKTGNPVVEIERVLDDGTEQPLRWSLLEAIDTLVVISFDSMRTRQRATADEVAALRRFLDDPDRVVFLCPHHDIGNEADLAPDEVRARQEAEFFHHGDKAIPPRQAFGGFASSLLAGLGVPVENRFGLRPAVNADGSPTEIEVDRAADRLELLDGVRTFNLHPHLPHLARVGDAVDKLDVLARQRIDPTAPPHPFGRDGHDRFDSLLQSRLDVFRGPLLVCDTTLFSSTAGGLDSLQRFWTRIVERPRRS
jgi:hypothetical protein